MMAYVNHFVVSVIVDGKPQREFSDNGQRSITLPFGSEYKIRIKNQSYKKALVDISIDGVSIFSAGKKLFLKGQETTEIERFVDDLNGGCKFKFVSKEQAAAEGHFDPSTPEMGLLKVEFIPEMEWPTLTVREPTFYDGGGLLGGGILRSKSLIGQSSHQSQFYCATNNSVQSNAQTQTGTNASLGAAIGATTAGMEIPTNTAAIGGTVEGGESSQKFSLNTEHVLWNFAKKTTIDIRMKGPQPLNFGIEGLPFVVKKDSKQYQIHSVMTTTEGSITVVYK